MWPAPDSFWPADVPREETVEAFQAAYRLYGFEPCETGEFEEGYEKIVLFVDDVGVPKHAARQLSQTDWTSKLGSSFDITHTFTGLNSREYGLPTLYFRRHLNVRAEADVVAADRELRGLYGAWE